MKNKILKTSIIIVILVIIIVTIIIIVDKISTKIEWKKFNDYKKSVFASLTINKEDYDKLIELLYHGNNKIEIYCIDDKIMYKVNEVEAEINNELYNLSKKMYSYLKFERIAYLKDGNDYILQISLYSRFLNKQGSYYSNLLWYCENSEAFESYEKIIPKWYYSIEYYE